MNPIVHAELSWLAGVGLRDRRDRLLVTLAGVVPDVDGLTLLAGQEAYATYHHLLSHGFVAALATAGLFAAFARRKLAVAALALVTFHLHLVCDLAGSGDRGLGGEGWPLYYFWPGNRVAWFWNGQWDLASWQNTSIGLAATLACLACALRWRRTIVELFSARADGLVVKTIRQRFLGERESVSDEAA